MRYPRQLMVQVSGQDVFPRRKSAVELLESMKARLHLIAAVILAALAQITLLRKPLVYEHDFVSVALDERHRSRNRATRTAHTPFGREHLHPGVVTEDPVCRLGEGGFLRIPALRVPPGACAFGQMAGEPCPAPEESNDNPSQPVGRVIELTNPILRGWVTYFAMGHSTRCFGYLRALTPAPMLPI